MKTPIKKKSLFRRLLIIILPILSLYFSGMMILLSCGLSLNHLHWHTFIIFWLEFHGNSHYDTLMYIGLAGFTLPIVIIGWVLLFI